MHSLTFLTAFYSLLVAAWAAPAPLEARSVSASQLTQFSLYEQYAAAAYCKDDNDNSAGAIICNSNVCPQVQTNGATSVYEFSDLGATDATGFIAIDNPNKLIVLSYRGSRSLLNFLGDVNFAFVETDICDGCQVHAGFFDSWTSSRDGVSQALAQAHQQYPGYTLVTTGHSLGAAVATLAAADLRQQGFNIALYTYGSPMVGNDVFANFVTAQTNGNFRITHAADAVPKLPGYLLSYRHVSPEYWINKPSGQTVAAGDIQMSTGILDLKGNGRTLTATLTDHLWYFNAITACKSGFEL
ncbi:hypothetical protein LTR66_016451 [Elasticomyces elasticus]|nr:hypothetical protein LTR66_016451 [Elasticomyces elasticus]